MFLYYNKCDAYAMTTATLHSETHSTHNSTHNNNTSLTFDKYNRAYTAASYSHRFSTYPPLFFPVVFKANFVAELNAK